MDTQNRVIRWGNGSRILRKEKVLKADDTDSNFTGYSFLAGKVIFNKLIRLYFSIEGSPDGPISFPSFLPADMGICSFSLHRLYPD